MRVALVTCAALPKLDSDDQLLFQVLQEVAGIQVEIPVWDDPAVDWRHYDGVVIRSTWDYVPKRDPYLAWVKAVSEKTRIWNSPSIIEWNTDKTYLRELANQGVPIVPTLWLKAGQDINLAEWMQQQEWDSIVAKPVISASGLDTYKITRDTSSQFQPILEALIQTRDVMVQPYFHSVETEGEVSFLFFGKEFSHAVRKLPARGEFRIQEQFGGQYEIFYPTNQQLDFARKVLEHMPDKALYARVDAMFGEDGQLYLGELEVTEPSMYLKLDPQAPRRFAEAIRQTLHSN